MNGYYISMKISNILDKPATCGAQGSCPVKTVVKTGKKSLRREVLYFEYAGMLKQYSTC